MKIKISITIGDDEVYHMEADEIDGNIKFEYQPEIGTQLAALLYDAAHFLEEDIGNTESDKGHENNLGLH